VRRTLCIVLLAAMIGCGQPTGSGRSSGDTPSLQPQASSLVVRDKRGHIKRSHRAKRQFMRQTGHPHGWKGHVVDHIVPLKRGGSDTPDNMQWQTTEEAKAKDRWE
jgi:hypothetical protein